MEDIHLVINAASGARNAENVLTDEVLPFLKANTSARLHEHRTRCEGDGVRIAREIISTAPQNSKVHFILFGGDGTTHEVINGIPERSGPDKFEVRGLVRIALVPTGTANALYASLYPGELSEGKDYRLKSVRALFSGNESDIYSLAMTGVTTTKSEEVTIAHLITSHALHASILADSEALRSTHPGIERFKIASAQNVNRWTNASLTLIGWGKTEDKFERFDPDSSTFKPVPLDDDSKTLSGPFLYFICVTTDRLEPNFVPAPFSGPTLPTGSPAQLGRPTDAVDILIIRPLRDPALKTYANRDASFWLSEDSASLRETFAKDRIGMIVGGMYDGGKHIYMRYDESGPLICEYYRCAGYEWTPLDARAKRTCIDGAILESDNVQVRVLGKEEGAGKVTVCK